MKTCPFIVRVCVAETIKSFSMVDDLWGFGGYTATNGYKYKLTSTSQTFQESREACRRMSGQLAYVGVRNSTLHR